MAVYFSDYKVAITKYVKYASGIGVILEITFGTQEYQNIHPSQLQIIKDSVSCCMYIP